MEDIHGEGLVESVKREFAEFGTSESENVGYSTLRMMRTCLLQRNVFVKPGRDVRIFGQLHKLVHQEYTGWPDSEPHPTDNPRFSSTGFHEFNRPITVDSIPVARSTPTTGIKTPPLESPESTPHRGIHDAPQRKGNELAAVDAGAEG